MDEMQELRFRCLELAIKAGAGGVDFAAEMVEFVLKDRGGGAYRAGVDDTLLALRSLYQQHDVDLIESQIREEMTRQAGA